MNGWYVFRLLFRLTFDFRLFIIKSMEKRKGTKRRKNCFEDNLFRFFVPLGI